MGIAVVAIVAEALSVISKFIGCREFIFLAHLPIPMAREGSPVTGAVAIPRIPVQPEFGHQHQTRLRDG